MKQTVNFSDFVAAFHRMDRDTQFTRDGLMVLFDYLETYEDDTGEELELDVIALCCEYSEDCADNIAAAYDIDIEDAEGDPEAVATIVRDYLNNNTILCGETDAGDFVYLQF